MKDGEVLDRRGVDLVKVSVYENGIGLKISGEL